MSDMLFLINQCKWAHFSGDMLKKCVYYATTYNLSNEAILISTNCHIVCDFLEALGFYLAMHVLYLQVLNCSLAKLLPAPLYLATCAAQIL